MQVDSYLNQKNPIKGDTMSQLPSQPKSHPLGQTNKRSSSESAGLVSRRRLFAGAGTLGAIAATAAFLPEAVPLSTPGAATKAAAKAPAKGGGYHLSEHVKRYYQTTLV